MNESAPAVDLQDCIAYSTAGLHIDPVKLLKYLDRRAILLAERTAKPRLDAIATELLRGHREEVLAFTIQLKKVIENAPS